MEQRWRRVVDSDVVYQSLLPHSKFLASGVKILLRVEGQSLVRRRIEALIQDSNSSLVLRQIY